MSSRILEHGTKENRRIVSAPRIHLFSDAVFAIAITLLIMVCIEERRYSDSNSEPLSQFILHEWPIFISFVFGFYTILICWFNHYLIFRYIRKTNSALVIYNAFVLFMVTSTPFPIAIVSENVKNNRHDALILCGVFFFMIALSFHLLWSCARRKGLLYPNTTYLKIRSLTALYRFGIFYTAIALFVSLLSLNAGVALYAIMFLIFAFPKKIAKLSNQRVFFLSKNGNDNNHSVK